LAARKTRVRGKQLETRHVLAPKKLQLPARARRHYDGSSTGDMIYGVHLPKPADEWQVPWKQKKVVYGKKHIIPVGGKTVDGDEPKEMNRQQNSEEPMCYHSPPLELYEEFLNQYFAKLVIDMAPSDGKMAWACLRNRVGYAYWNYLQCRPPVSVGRKVAVPAGKGNVCGWFGHVQFCICCGFARVFCG